MVSIVFTKQEVDELTGLETATNITKPEKAKVTTSDDPLRIHRANEDFPRKFKPQEHMQNSRLERCPPPQKSRGSPGGTLKKTNVHHGSSKSNQHNETQAALPLDLSSLFGYPSPPQQTSKHNDWIPNFLKPSRSATKTSVPKTLQSGRSIEPPEMHLPHPKLVEANGDDRKPKTQGLRDKSDNDEFDFQDPWELDITDADLR